MHIHYLGMYVLRFVTYCTDKQKSTALHVKNQKCKRIWKDNTKYEHALQGLLEIAEYVRRIR